MNETVIPIAKMGASKQRKREAPKGRSVTPAALSELEALLGKEPLRHDLLIEYLHLINDRYKQLAAPHLAALARMLGLAQTEVYEVATFYHHFDVVKEEPDGAIKAPAALTVRVCDGLSCEMAGAKKLLERLPALLGREVRVTPAPCVGRCEQAPVAVVHQKPVAERYRWRRSRGRWLPGDTRDKPGDYIDFERTEKQGGYATLRDCVERRRDVESVIKTMEDSGLRGLGGAGFPAGPQVAHRARRSCAATDGREHRRGRTRHLQRSRLSGARSASVSGGHAHRGLGRGHFRDLYLSAR